MPDMSGPAPSATARALRPVQRTGAYAVVGDADGRTLLVRASARSDLAGRWFLPGGGVGHGEPPADAVVREVAEETGLDVRIRGLRAAVSDVIDLPHRGVRVHTVRVLFEAEVTGGTLRPEQDGTSDGAAFVSPEEAAARPLMPYVAGVLGLTAPPPVATVPQRPEPLGGDGGPDIGAADDAVGPGTPPAPVRRQRPAAYAILRDGDRVLLTHVTGSGGTWTLPGGGIDHGEDPVGALAREVHEEAGLPWTPGALLHVSSAHFTGPAPDGRLEDFHAIRLVYGGAVPSGVPPRVVEVGGTTDEAAWVPVADLDRLRVSDVVRHGLRVTGG